MKTMVQRIVLFMTFMVLAGASAGAQEAAVVDLRPRWTEGQTATYEATTARRTTTEMSAGGKSRTSDTAMEVKAKMTWRVTEAHEAGGGVGEMAIDEMTITITAPDGSETVVDGRGGGDQRLAAINQFIKAMQGKAVEVTVDSTGHVTKVSGWRAIQRQAGDLGESLEQRDFEEMASDLAWIVGGAAAVEPGDTWREKFNWSHEAGDLHHDSRYEFEGIEEIAGLPVAIVTRATKLRLDPKLPEGGPPVDLRMTEGKQTSQIMFDLTRREVVGQNIDRTMRYQADIPLGDQTLTTRVSEQLNGQILRTSER